MTEKIYVVHALKGRTRLRVPRRRGDHAFFGELAQRIAHGPGVHRVEQIPLAGSVLVHHEGDVRDLAELFLDPELGALVTLASNEQPRTEVLVIDRRGRIRRRTLDLANLLSLGLFAVAGLQVLRSGQISGPVSLAWYAAELLRRIISRPGGGSTVPS